MVSTEDKLDAYVFIGNGRTEAFQRLGALEPGTVRYATPLLSGAYGHLAFVEVEGRDNLGELERKLGLVRDAVNPPETDTSIKVKEGYLAAPTRWSDKGAVAAFVRIRVAPQKADAVLDAIAGLPHYWGSAIVAGSYDILLELSGASLSELNRVLLDEMHVLTDIVSTDTSFALNRPKDGWTPGAMA